MLRRSSVLVTVLIAAAARVLFVPAQIGPTRQRRPATGDTLSVVGDGWPEATEAYAALGRDVPGLAAADRHVH